MNLGDIGKRVRQSKAMARARHGYRQTPEELPGWGTIEVYSLGSLRSQLNRFTDDEPGCARRRRLYGDAPRILQQFWAMGAAADRGLEADDEGAAGKRKSRWVKPSDGLPAVRYLRVPSKPLGYWLQVFGIGQSHYYRCIDQLVRIGAVCRIGMMPVPGRRWRKHVLCVGHPADWSLFWNRVTKSPAEGAVTCPRGGDTEYIPWVDPISSALSGAREAEPEGKERPPTAAEVDCEAAELGRKYGLTTQQVEELAGIAAPFRAVTVRAWKGEL